MIKIIDEDNILLEDGLELIAVNPNPHMYCCFDCFFLHNGPCEGVECKARGRQDGRDVIFRIKPHTIGE